MARDVRGSCNPSTRGTSGNENGVHKNSQWRTTQGSKRGRDASGYGGRTEGKNYWAKASEQGEYMQTWSGVG